MHRSSMRPPRARHAGRILFSLAVSLAATLSTPRGSAAQTVVKLATLAPDGSIWHTILMDQVERWETQSVEPLDVRIYPGGVAGDDPAVVRKMRIGQFQGAALSVEGLVEIDDGFRVFQIPMFYRSPAEALHVFDALAPVLRERLEEKGFVVLTWGYGGWVHLYSKQPVRTVEELQGLKLFLWGGEERAMRISRGAGLQPVGLAATDITMGLQTGIIDAMATTPLAALAFQWFRVAEYQIDPGIAPLMGATVMTRRAWDRLTADQQASARTSVDGIYERLQTEVIQAEEEAVEAMVARGLTVVRVTQTDPSWRALVDALAEGHRRDLVPPDVYELALRARDEFRAAQSAPAGDGR